MGSSEGDKKRAAPFISIGHAKHDMAYETAINLGVTNSSCLESRQFAYESSRPWAVQFGYGRCQCFLFGGLSMPRRSCAHSALFFQAHANFATFAPDV